MTLCQEHNHSSRAEVKALYKDCTQSSGLNKKEAPEKIPVPDSGHRDPDSWEKSRETFSLSMLYICVGAKNAEATSAP